MSNSNQPLRPILERGQMLPPFTLPGADNLPHGPWDYKQREHLMLLFLQSTTKSEARDLLCTFAQAYKDLREEQCALLVITADPVIINLQTQDELHLPFPLLSDASATIIPRYTLWDSTQSRLTPALILADRYGEIYSSWMTEQEAELPPLSELLTTLRYLNSLCTP